ncbi:MAG: S-layer homology domain-containing protein, partial [Brachybacterium sp.]|nr:S-layer homology domain-containing protein [Brachybacterium sp.]
EPAEPEPAKVDPAAVEPGEAAEVPADTTEDAPAIEAAPGAALGDEPAADEPVVPRMSAFSDQQMVQRILADERQVMTAFATASATGFRDITPRSAFYHEIMWLQRQGITTGWPDGTFRPYESITRDAYVAMLFRIQAPANYRAPAVSPFRDVRPTTQFYREITWAHGQGIITGWADGTFRPTRALTRSDAMVLLHRAFGGGAPAAQRSPFLDVTPRYEHYQGIAWGYRNGITTGWADGTFRPHQGIHRNAMAAMLHRVVELGLDEDRSRLSGPTGRYWNANAGASIVGNPVTNQYVWGTGLRQDFQRGAVVYNPATRTSYFLRGPELTTFTRGGALATFGMPVSGRAEFGGSVYQLFTTGGIYTTDGFTFVVTGEMYQRYQAEGGIRGYLHAPIGDARTGSSGITYQNFKGGQLIPTRFLDTPMPTTVSGGTRITYRTLQVGSRGDDVYAVQVKLGIPADGVFGQQTRGAVLAYQREQGIPQTGIVDSRTWARVMSVPNRIFDGSNGRLAAHQLTIVAPDWTLPNAAAADFLAMHRAFTAETGLRFTLNDAYRPIDRQIQLLVALGRPTAAYPGTSNHGNPATGAVDIRVTRGDVTHRWLVANAARFGFGQTAWQAANEPWHWQRV